MKKEIVIVVIILVFAASSAFSWNGDVRGKIAQVDVTAAGNYPFRVVLQGGPALCSNGHTWAYLNDADANYKVYVGALLAAKLSGNEVTILTEHDTVGYCRIGYIKFH